tara:strand:+ start:2178 stop:2696 length:519 start_codon:yes stop_codon:yes gene_type:complete
MILGLDVSTSITGATLLDENGEIIYNEAWDTRKYKNFFRKAEEIDAKMALLPVAPTRVYIEQSLQSFRSGFSSARTLSTLSRFNGVVSWICYRRYAIEPEYLAATSARKQCGITVPRGSKAKNVVLQFVVDNVPDVSITYTRNNNPRPECFDKADSWVIARAGWLLCQNKQK